MKTRNNRIGALLVAVAMLCTLLGGALLTGCDSNVANSGTAADGKSAYELAVENGYTGVVLVGLLMVGYGHSMVIGKDGLAVVLVQLPLCLCCHTTCLLIHTLLLTGDALLLSTHSSLFLIDTKVLLGHTVALSLHTGTLGICTGLLSTDASILSVDASVFMTDTLVLSTDALCLVFGHLGVNLNEVVGFGLDAAHVDDAEPPLLICQWVPCIARLQRAVHTQPRGVLNDGCVAVNGCTVVSALPGLADLIANFLNIHIFYVY